MFTHRKQILSGTDGTYNALRTFSKGIMAQLDLQKEDEHWNILDGGFFLLDHAFALKSSLVDTEQHDLELSLPVDLAVFSFGCDYSFKENSVLLALLRELYFVLWSVGNQGDAQTTQSICDYIHTQWRELYHTIIIDDNSVALEDFEDIREPIIRLCIFMLATYVLGPDMTNNTQLSPLTTRLATLLRKTGFGLEAHSTWMPFPGALTLCHTIGLRFSEGHEKMWFAIQFMKLSHAWVMQNRETSSRSISLVSNAVRKIQPLKINDA